MSAGRTPLAVSLRDKSGIAGQHSSAPSRIGPATAQKGRKIVCENAYGRPLVAGSELSLVENSSAPFQCENAPPPDCLIVA